MGLSQSSGRLAESIESQRCQDRRATGNWRIKGRGRAVPTRRNAVICPLKSLMIPPSCEVKHGGAMEGDDAGIGHRDARAMLDAFASVGATRFDVTWTTCAGEKEWFRRGMSFYDLAQNLPRMLDEAPSKQRNVIVRPHGPAVTFIQLDDLASATLSRLAPAVFLTLQTSPGNFQAWVAMAGLDDNDFARRLRKGAGADPTASGATRVAGSLPSDQVARPILQTRHRNTNNAAGTVHRRDLSRKHVFRFQDVPSASRHLTRRGASKPRHEIEAYHTRNPRAASPCCRNQDINTGGGLK
jgi:RepB DNA-primase from phage plasmid